MMPKDLTDFPVIEYTDWIMPHEHWIFGADLSEHFNEIIGKVVARMAPKGIEAWCFEPKEYPGIYASQSLKW